MPPFPKYVGHRDEARGRFIRPDRVKEIISSQDEHGRWLTELRATSHPFVRHGSAEIATGNYSETLVGDETDTSPYPSPTPFMGISTAVFVRNMNDLIEFVADERAPR